MPQPTDPHDQAALIVLRMPRARKGRYVAASRAAGLKLFDWILATLDASAPPIPDHDPHQTQPKPDAPS